MSLKPAIIQGFNMYFDAEKSHNTDARHLGGMQEAFSVESGRQLEFREKVLIPDTWNIVDSRKPVIRDEPDGASFRSYLPARA